MDSNSNSASELWAKVKSGDKNALSDLYGMYADALYLFGKAYTLDHQLVEDCIHDLFIELYMRRKKLPVARNVKNYLFTVLRRKIAELSNSRLVVVSAEDDYAGRIYRNHEVSAETQIIHIEEKAQHDLLFSNTLNKLTLKQRKGVYMKFYENKSYDEMALSLDISIETARTLIYRGLKSMKKNLS